MPFMIVRRDITTMKVDAIVNAANTELLMGGGVCGAIFYAAGPRELQRACDKVAPIRTGGAAITPGFRLPAKYVIHAAGPIYDYRDKEQCAGQLRSAYIESLKLAVENKCNSIAFPLISSGIYGYPKVEALQVATAAITDFLAENEMDVYLAVFDRNAFIVSEQLMGEVAGYIDEHYIDSHDFDRSQFLDIEKASLTRANAPAYGAAPEGLDEAGSPEALAEKNKANSSAPLAEKNKANSRASLPEMLDEVDSHALLSEMRYKAASPKMMDTDGSLENLVDHLDEPFSVTLLKLIDSKGKTDVEVYKKANIDRKLFSKIRSVKGYTPKKPTILALAIALELSLAETDDLLERAGYALSHASKFDVIVEYFIVSGKYNIFDINEVLFKYDQPLLGG